MYERAACAARLTGNEGCSTNAAILRYPAPASLPGGVAPTPYPGERAGGISRPFAAVAERLRRVRTYDNVRECNVRIVMHPDRSRNPFLEILKRSLEDSGCEVFSWAERPDPDSVDVFLPQWPENQWYTRRMLPVGRAKSAVRRRLFLSYAKKVQARGGVVCWFAHDRMPHLASADGVPLDRWIRLIEPFHRLIDSVVHLTTASIVDPAFSHLRHLPHAVVPHPHYPLVDPAVIGTHPAPLRQLVFINGTEPRKEAASALRALRGAGLKLVITGASGQSRDVDELIVSLPNAEFRGGPLSDEDLQGILSPGSAVVLCQKNLLNSGVMFFALSRAVPVICPRNPVNLEIAGELADGWVRTYSTLAEIRDCLGPAPGGVPDLSHRSPEALARVLVGHLHALRPTRKT